MVRKMIDDDWKFTSSNGDITLVLVGRRGNGKSATGNSILRRKGFKTEASFNGVTSVCDMQSTYLEDGHALNVIDAPGLFDFSDGSKLIGKEIVKCIDLAKDGIHAFLFVISLRSCFSKEEEAVLTCLKNLLGEKITDYVIVVFSGGDELDDDGVTLEEYLGNQWPETLQNVLHICKGRVVLFDNITKEEIRRSHQLHQLLSLVNMVDNENGGQPYTDEIFKQVKENSLMLHNVKETSEMEGLVYEKNEEHLNRITQMEGSMILHNTTEVESLKRRAKNAMSLNHKYNKQPILTMAMVLLLFLSLVSVAVHRNGGKPCTDEVKAELKLKMTMESLQKQLAEEQVARMEAEKRALEFHEKLLNEIRNLILKMETTNQEIEVLRGQFPGKHWHKMVELSGKQWRNLVEFSGKQWHKLIEGTSTIEGLQKQLDDEQVARMEAQRKAQESNEKFSEENVERLERAHQEIQDLCGRVESENCAIL